MAITYKFVLNTVPDGKPANVPRLVMLRITSQRVMKFVDTTVYARPAEFNPDGEAQKKNWIRRTHPQHELLNLTLSVWHERITTLTQRLTQVGGTYTAQQVKDRLLGKQDESFSGFIESRIETWQRNGQDDNARNHLSMLIRLREFLFNYKTPKRTKAAPPTSPPPQVDLNHLSPEVITAFEAWLLSRPGKSEKSTAATRRNYATDRLRRLRQHITAYIAKYRLPSEADPTRGMKLQTVETETVWSTQTEIATWEKARLNLEQPTWTGNRGPFMKGRNTLEAARVFYLSSYYLHGIRAGDLMSLKVGQLEQRWEMQEGKAISVTRLFYTSDKKDKTKSVLVEPFLLEMLQPYLVGKEPDAFLFPFLPAELRFMDENRLGPEIDKRVSYINKLLKKIAIELGTSPNVAMHAARRSFADELYEMTGDLRIVQDALHHSNILTTQRYVQKGKQQRVDQANQVYRRRESTETILKQNEENSGTDSSIPGIQSA
ncbi:tyrosine-type recombinase/integrase [Fibrella sp. ES10-3-2-2]|nr:hypothetical protein A6C57_01360 [Fibrella sp. ES10-3-2-2]